jgi:Flp pilus assembly protein TadG
MAIKAFDRDGKEVAMSRLKNRKGVFVVLFGILFMALMAAAALSMDFARIWAMRNELQTTADAAALAGAVQISKIGANSDDEVDDAVHAQSDANLAMGVTAAVDSVIIGNWTDTPTGGRDNWTPLCTMVSGTCVAWPTIPTPVPPRNAVRTVVSHATNQLIMGALRITAPNVHARATAWADAPISTTNCIKPWSIPYAVLMAKINAKQGTTNDATTLTRPFTEADKETLRNMTEEERTFTLKQGAQGSNDPYPDGTTAPGNFQRVQLPKFKAYEDWNVPNTEWPEGASNGTNDYKDAISGAVCHTLDVGDSLATLTGNAPEPTLDAIAPAVCSSLINNERLSTNGDCINSSGGVGVDIKAAFHQCVGNCNGMNYVEVKMLGAFTLKKVYPNKDNGPNPQWETGQIVGVFNPIAAEGPVGGSTSLLNTIILVK